MNGLWKQATSLPADSVVRTVGGMEAVHHPATVIRRECVIIRDGNDAVRRMKTAKGTWTKPDRVPWSHGSR